MTNGITITATLNAWTTSQWRMDNLMRFLKDGKQDEAVDELSFSLGDGMGRGENPWTLVGTAEIRVSLVSQDEMVASQLTALRAELDHHRAAWLTKQQEIMERISKLQALTNEVVA
jgi:hypothetical protein